MALPPLPTSRGSWPALCAATIQGAANASRRELLAAGLPDERLGRVMGLASSNLLEEDAPFGAINSRISILVMSREAEARLKGAALPPSSGKAGPAKP